MKIEELRTLYAKRPFCPFVIHLADGQAIPVEHPEFLAIGPEGDPIFVFRVGVDRSFDIIDMSLVTTLEVMGDTSLRR
ncbi:MAG: hypothetical protein QME42_04870 [bacterium]|nr:hypothetical protein [bacterium]